MDGVLVQGDVHLLKHLLHLGARQPKRPQVPEHQVVLSALGGELVALGDEELRKRRGVGLDLLGVRLELWRRHLLQLRGEACDLVIVRAALQRWEDGLVDRVLILVVAAALLRAAAEEDHAGARAAQRLVGGGGDDVAVVEGVLRLASRHEAADVRDVRHHVRAGGVTDLANALVVPVPRVGGGAGDDQLRAEHEGELLHLVIVDVACL
mmetsp:Transcript_10472/g.26037  ORF Transcript_10472/g.26037 Transcript_10472/m.26037 type:complete len:209 (+) Transcript_10472:529-1155(+)